MIYISQEREEGYIIAHNPEIKLYFNRHLDNSFFLIGGSENEKVLAGYPSIQRGREVLERIKNQFSYNPDSVFSFPEK